MSLTTPPNPDNAILHELVQRVVQLEQPEKVILFGSRARGNARPGSDYDLLVIKDIPSSARKACRRRIYRSLQGLGIAKDVILATPEDVRRFGSLIGTILKPALEEGIVLYERAA